MSHKYLRKLDFFSRVLNSTQNRLTIDIVSHCKDKTVVGHKSHRLNMKTVFLLIWIRMYTLTYRPLEN